LEGSLTQPLVTLQSMGDLIPMQAFAADVSADDLSDTERRVMSWLSSRLMGGDNRWGLELSQLYYDGMNRVPSLGISVPPELEPLRAVLGWCSTAVEARSERLNVQGFRMPGETTINTSLQEIWQHNNLDAEAPLIHEQAMTSGWTYGIVGKSDDSSGFPLITTESALNMSAAWDPRRREISAAFQRYLDCDPTSDTYGKWLGTLYTRTSIIQLSSDQEGTWKVDKRNDHDQGFVPVVQFTPRPLFLDRLCGRSEIAPAWRNTQDRACRTLVRMEIASEFFAVAKLIILGATEESFQKADGSKASAWETYTGRISTLEADENGNLPNVIRIAGESPDGFISALNHERSIMAGHTGLSPDYLGIFSDGNPTSADAIVKGDFRLAKIAERLSASVGNDWEKLMVMALKITGEHTETADQLETDWAPFSIPTPTADTVNVTTQVQAGMVSPRSDDALAKVGWSPVQRARIAQDMEKQKGLAVIHQAISGLKPAQPSPGSQPQQAVDGEQPMALQALNSQRTTKSAATAG
jgi:hypothetical protein